MLYKDLQREITLTTVGPDPLLLYYNSLENMNVFMTFEENIIISSKSYIKETKCHRQTNGRTENEYLVSPQIQFLVPYNISHANHPLMRIYFPKLPLYYFVDFTFSYSKQHYS